MAPKASVSEGSIESVYAGTAMWAVIEGDCLDVMRRLQKVDHIIMDPPYEKEAHTLQRRVRRGPGDRNAVVEPLNFAPIDEATREHVTSACGRLVRRWVLAFCQAEAVATWRESIMAAGLSWRRSCIWVKPDGMPQLTGDRPGMGYESIACAHAKGRSRWNGGGRVGVFVANKRDASSRDGTRGEHPTIKPVALMLELVSLFTDPGELILDPFMGSGSTGCAAIRLGRRFIGIEREAKYCRLARERLNAETTNSSLAAVRRGQLGLFP